MIWERMLYIVSFKNGLDKKIDYENRIRVSVQVKITFLWHVASRGWFDVLKLRKNFLFSSSQCPEELGSNYFQNFSGYKPEHATSQVF